MHEDSHGHPSFGAPQETEGFAACSRWLSEAIPPVTGPPFPRAPRRGANPVAFPPLASLPIRCLVRQLALGEDDLQVQRHLIAPASHQARRSSMDHSMIPEPNVKTLDVTPLPPMRVRIRQGRALAVTIPLGGK